MTRPRLRPARSLAVLLAIAAAVVLAGHAGRARADCPHRAQWPTTSWISTTAETSATRGPQIRALEDFVFTLTGADADRTGTRTDAVLIVQGGTIVYERYARGWRADQPHYTWSVSKSVTNNLVGIAVGAGAVRLDDPVCRHVTLPRADHVDFIVQHLLEFSSGLDWAETYENKSNQDSSVLAMLYGVGRRDMLAFVAGHDSRDPPGTTYMYSSGDTTFLAGVVDRAMRPSHGVDWAWDTLFTPLGMESVTFERDAAGTPVGSSYVYATPRDLARLGLFWLDDGCWEERRVLPEGWMRDSVAVSAPFRKRPLDTDPGDVQGRQFWLNRAVPEQNVTQPWPDVPADAFAARGHWGQSVTVIPSRDLVIVRLADDRDGTFDFGRFLALAAAVAP